ncbi:MAG: inositol-3-phosphate synthase [Candidatus Bathyarchaeia archaeon]
MSNRRVRVAIVGVGNCCSALIQGLRFYREKKAEEAHGILHYELGGYTADSLEVAAAFDVDRRKVGNDLSQAIFTQPNNYKKIVDIPMMNIPVLMGAVLDGVNAHLESMIEVASQREVDIVEVLKDHAIEVFINLLPTGADEASRFYAKAALEAGCAFINATPAPIAGDVSLVHEFEERKLPVIGDDVMSQIGGTVFHRNILEFLAERGVKVDNSYQLDVGGGMETYNTLDPKRRMLKRGIKTSTIRQGLPYEADIVAGTTDYVGFLENSRTSYYWISGRYYLDTPLQVDIYLRTVDAPNAAAILIDSARAAKIALDRGVGGPLSTVCHYGYKRPPTHEGEERVSTVEAHKRFREFIEGKRNQ